MSEGTDPVVPTDLATSDPERDVEMLAPEGEATATPRKRRRRGGRGRGGSRSAATSASAEGAEGAQPPPAAAEPAVLSEEASTLEEAPDGPASGTGKRKRRRVPGVPACLGHRCRD